MQAELTKMVGSKVYDRFVALVREREVLRTKGVALPHPAVRSRQNGGADALASVAAEGDS